MINENEDCLGKVRMGLSVTKRGGDDIDGWTSLEVQLFFFLSIANPIYLLYYILISHTNNKVNIIRINNKSLAYIRTSLNARNYITYIGLLLSFTENYFSLSLSIIQHI